MTAPSVFNRRLLAARRATAAAAIGQFDFALKEVAERLNERLGLVRKDLPVILDLGSHHGVLASFLRARPGTETVIVADLTPALARAAGGLCLTADEEALPFAHHSLDAVISNLSLHWANDLPGALAQIRQALKPDGFFLASLLGAPSLHELRACLMEAEMQITGGASPRVSPFPTLHDMAALLQRAGFALPVADQDTITIEYPDLFTLARDIRGLGGANALINRLTRPTGRRVFQEAAKIFQEKFSNTVTVHILYATGWAPHESQPQPLTPGSATLRLADALNISETKI